MIEHCMNLFDCRPLCRQKLIDHHNKMPLSKDGSEVHDRARHGSCRQTVHHSHMSAREVMTSMYNDTWKLMCRL